MTGFNSKRDAAADKMQEPEREALKLAKDVLLRLVHLTNHDDEIYQVVDKCEAALAQPAQEPVAYVTGMSFGRCIVEPLNPAMVLPVGMALYSSSQGNT